MRRTCAAIEGATLLRYRGRDSLRRGMGRHERQRIEGPLERRRDPDVLVAMVGKEFIEQDLPVGEQHLGVDAALARAAQALGHRVVQMRSKRSLTRCGGNVWHTTPGTRWGSGVDWGIVRAPLD